MKLWYICIILTCSSACLTGANTQSLWNKNKKQTWATAKKDHAGKYLSELDLHTIKKASNESHFNETLKNVLIVRVVDTTGHAKVRQYIRNEMQRLGWTVEEHVFKDKTPLGTKTFRNIIATLNPSATRFLVIACHYDSKITPKGFLGATDSAVPCAMMINLAYTLFDGLQSHKLSDNELTLRFIFFDGEEALRSWTSKDSLYGSRKLAELMAGTPYPPGNREDTTELDRIDLFVLLDLLGASNCNFRNFPFVNVQKWYEVFVNLERNTNLSTQPRNPLFSDRNIFGKIEDDHIPFLERGVQILHLISYPFPKAWHELGDNFNSLDFNVIETLNNLVRAFVVHYLHVNL